MRTAAVRLGLALVLAAIGFPFGVNVELAGASDVGHSPGATDRVVADGSEVPIREVKVGDKVLATDPVSGVTAARRVVALIREHETRTMVRLGLSDGSTITSTDLHPFWDASSATFTYAIDLPVGDQLLTDDGRYLTVTSTHSSVRELKTYNLTIAGIHTYYAGTTPVLVHNSCIGDVKALAERIANGHSFEKHVVKAGEFIGIRTKGQFAKVIEDVVENGEVRQLRNGRTAYWKKTVVVIHNPADVDWGTAFAPKEGYYYFTHVLK